MLAWTLTYSTYPWGRPLGYLGQLLWGPLTKPLPGERPFHEPGDFHFRWTSVYMRIATPDAAGNSRSHFNLRGMGFYQGLGYEQLQLLTLERLSDTLLERPLNSFLGVLTDSSD